MENKTKNGFIGESLRAKFRPVSAGKQSEVCGAWRKSHFHFPNTEM